MARKGKSKLSSTDKFRQVYLNIVGKNLDPERITKALGIEPYYSFRRGEPCGKNSKTKTKQGCWTLEGHPSGSRIETQLKNIIEIIKPVRHRMRRILKDESIGQAYLTIAVEPPDWVVVAGYCFSAELLHEFTSLGIDIAFSLYIPGKLAKGA